MSRLALNAFALLGRDARLAVALLPLLAAGCSTFSPAADGEPDYYIDEYGMVHVPDRDLASGAPTLRPAYGRFSPVLQDRSYYPFYDPFYDSFFARGQYPFARYSRYPGFSYNFVSYRAPGYGRTPPVSVPVDPVDGSDGGLGQAPVPVASPVLFISRQPESVLDSRSTARETFRQRGVDRGRGAYARPSQAASRARPAPQARQRQAEPVRKSRPVRSKPRVIDP